MSKKKDTPGNAIAAQAMFERELLALGKAVHSLEYTTTVTVPEWGHVKSIRFRPPSETNDEWLAVIAVGTESDAVVGFHSASTFGECVRGLANRLKNGSLTWRKDEYARRDNQD